MTTTDTRITEDQEQDAIRVLRQSYYADVSDYARWVADEARKRNEDNPEDEIDDLAHEYTDGSEWVIYTWRARLVRSLSDNADAVEDYGWTHAGDLDEAITSGAYCAMRADVADAARRILAAD